MHIKSITRKKVRDISSLGKANKIVEKKKNTFCFSSWNKKIIQQKTISFIVLFFLLTSVIQNNVMAPIFFQSREAIASNDEERARLQKELEAVEKEIAQYEGLVATTQQEKAALQNKINELKNRADKINLQIKSTNLNLEYLNVRIDETTTSIVQTNDKINTTKNNLSNLLQTYSQLDQTSLVEILLGSETISEFFDYSNALHSIQEKILENIKELGELRVTLNNQSQELTSNKEETQLLLAMQMLQQQDLEKTRKEQGNLLEVTKGNEQRYQQMLAESRQKATEIKGRIYQLLGVKTQVTFGEALDIANWVSSRLGVRPALLLAVLTQESNLGQNVGTCNRAGDPAYKSWREVMKPDRDQAPFLKICQELGIDPDTTPVSCPMYQGGQQMGWGGAMGPAQFIPSTWMSYKDQVSSITGNYPANPWDIKDAFVAAGLYLAKWGATQQTRDAEWRAAMIYFSGSTNTKYRFYGDSVLAIADRYAQDISYLKSVAKQ
ncbi:MAG: lytic murein transglycosylase [Candidatus Pacebacteria bacterium]|nr:lytic murein transglycosylase [Candidatus Paceibacterota bacterium]MDD5721979.1 lytic murein transglycosylase [Candidatus Paceibacterota bacterium]